jgi:hypothetical protein
MLPTNFSPDSPYWVTWVRRGLLQNNEKETWKKATAAPLITKSPDFD